MIDPTKFTNFGLSKNRLEEYILFSIAVAGKNATTTARILEELLFCHQSSTPFGSIKQFKSETKLRNRMQKIGFGCYNLKARGFWWIVNANIDLKNCTVDDLEKCPGVGMKTSRFFVMHTRDNNCQVACLDTHILKFMRDRGFKNIPKQTPPRKRYLEIEQDYLKLCDKEGKHPAHFDLEIWNHYASK